MKRDIPRCMSSQHPDNARSPFFVNENILGGEDEIKEAYYVFSHLDCEEQMWDCEGKETDDYVVKKLFTRHPDFFRKNVLGKDRFITLRVPNPTVERQEAKLLLEAMESIPRSYDVSRHFLDNDTPPIFEVILPMTTSVKCIDRIYHYYQDFVIGKETTKFSEEDITIGEWIGDFNPKNINVIPLFEDYQSILNADQIMEEYSKNKDLDYARVFFARSDPALNYGSISAVLLNKIALYRLEKLEKKLGIPIYPIIGVGSAPFRGNFKPTNIENCLTGYPSVQTFTLQSAFKYDYPEKTVMKAVELLQKWPRGKAISIDEQRCINIIDKVKKAYQKNLTKLAPLINHMALHIPNRRRRKLHIGLFGYSRSVGDTHLPRAIRFTAALYSLGIPPEILGMEVLNDDDYTFLEGIYPNLSQDLRDALTFLNRDNLKYFEPEIMHAILKTADRFNTPANEEHSSYTNMIFKELDSNQITNLPDLVLSAASQRNFLG